MVFKKKKTVNNVTYFETIVFRVETQYFLILNLNVYRRQSIQMKYCRASYFIPSLLLSLYRCRRTPFFHSYYPLPIFLPSFPASFAVTAADFLFLFPIYFFTFCMIVVTVVVGVVAAVILRVLFLFVYIYKSVFSGKKKTTTATIYITEKIDYYIVYAL